ncbi:MAG: hypothetical protein LBJ67_09570 [Planctomycetaceae bacterium]|nr:hypothetical protein [Planctomycetaceae bacterium]
MARKQAVTIELSGQERGILKKIVQSRTLEACLHDRLQIVLAAAESKLVLAQSEH